MTLLLCMPYIYIYVTRWLQQWFIPRCLVSGVTTLGGLRWNLADVELAQTLEPQGSFGFLPLYAVCLSDSGLRVHLCHSYMSDDCCCMSPCGSGAKVET